MKVKKCLIVVGMILSVCLLIMSNQRTFASTEGHTIFGDLSGFEVKEGTDGIPLTLGTTFAVREAGTITAVRMYTSATESGTFIVEIWDVETKEHIAGPFDWELEAGTAGWRVFNLAEPVRIEADKDYMVSVRNNTSSLSYQMVLGYFQSIDSSESVFNLENSYGAYSSDLSLFPEGRNNVSFPAFLRDVVFVPDSEVTPEPTTEITSEPTSEPESNPQTGDYTLPVVMLLTIVAFAGAILFNRRKAEG